MEHSQSKKLCEKVNTYSMKSLSTERSEKLMNLRDKGKENHCYKPRMAQSMFIESGKDFLLSDVLMETSSKRGPSLMPTTIPKPYKNLETSNSMSILSKTQTYLQERKKRSQSQPPEKIVKQQFEFLSTSQFSLLQTCKNKESKNSQNKTNSKDGCTITKVDVVVKNHSNKFKASEIPSDFNYNYRNHNIHISETPSVKRHTNFNFKKSCKIFYPQAFRQTLV
eukprot:TRINITY_DN30722_c0_g1_i1.p1 TRINITY_DN30722_c0_g1~~TRINITY_DN30722_c0_g1_i1.p1  ORF type:complete len:262 (+),score=50.31 TRINITY_DN30722_c0_g1_i1:120-788(+)